MYQNSGFKHIDLFSGIGGFALACRWNGIETVQFVEIDPFCQKVLNKNFPGVPIHDDIKTFKYDGEPPFILTGGFPCQPFSCAGKRRGKEDDRFLWPEMLRVVSETKPRWIVGENVTGIINMELDSLLFDMENIGYETQAFTIPACAVNADFPGDRVWVVGATEGIGLFEIQMDRRTVPKNNIWEPCSVSQCADASDVWQTDQPCIYGIGDGLPKTLDEHRFKALGNSIVPQVVAEIILAILNIETSSN